VSPVIVSPVIVLLSGGGRPILPVGSAASGGDVRALRWFMVVLAVLWAVGVPMLHGHVPGLSNALHAQVLQTAPVGHSTPSTIAMSISIDDGDSHGEANLPSAALVAAMVLLLGLSELPPTRRGAGGLARPHRTSVASRGSPVTRFELAIV
jgi:hypothetical protein